NGTEVMGADFSESMIERAGLKAGGANPLVVADAGHLPFASGSFDCVATAFSFRNLLYKNPSFETYLSEVIRILKRGGYFVIVETSQPDGELLRKAYHGYLRTVVPLVGRLISGSKSSYTYLSRSALNFPVSEEITAILRGAGFRKVTFEPIFLGVVGIHTAKK
ncbi:MAG: class I SAM-dependent methyltransferase, partial [Thermoplasmata archaeon]